LAVVEFFFEVGIFFEKVYEVFFFIVLKIYLWADFLFAIPRDDLVVRDAVTPR
jgi:hypothetical protein